MDLPEALILLYRKCFSHLTGAAKQFQILIFLGNAASNSPLIAKKSTDNPCPRNDKCDLIKLKEHKNAEDSSKDKTIDSEWNQRKTFQKFHKGNNGQHSDNKSGQETNHKQRHVTDMQE